MALHNEFGKWGEDFAAAFLREQGYVILERDWHSGHRDIDIVAVDGQTIVFVEVKTRKTGTPGAGLAAVDIRKQQRIARAAMCFLMNRNMLGHPVRFDVIEICSGTVIHIADAFQPGAMFYR